MKTSPILFFVLIAFLSACAPSGKMTEPALDQSPASNQAGSDGNGTASSGGDIANAAGTGDALTDSGSGRAPTSSASPASPSKTVAAPFNSLPEGAAKFNRPWLNSATSIVIDAYQGNAIDFKKMATDARVAGVIHRSSIGLKADSQYAARRKLAKTYGFLWGAYHLGRSGDPVAQAKFFLQTVGGDADTLMFLDLEDTSASDMMSTANAVKFMNYVYQTTGRVPVIYANDAVTKAVNKALSKEPIFLKSRLWYARFLSQIKDFPKGIWSTYFLWQFQSELNCSRVGSCLYTVPGVDASMDINVFYGSRDALASQWR